jgi:hypothetical protein
VNSEHLEAYLAGELDQNGREQVEHALRRDSDLRASFVVQAQMEAALQVLLGTESAKRKDEFDRGVIARLRSEGAGDHRGFAKSVLTEIVEEREGLRPIRWPDLIKTGLISAAASIGLLLVLQTAVYRDVPRNGGERSGKGSIAGFAARIERSEGASWTGETAGKIREDGWLTTGVLNLDSGTALIAFNSGATAVVEGPAVLSIESANRMFLKSGKLTAEVPPPASGFTVNTPRFNAVDIGTRFGVSVESNGDSELHVMQGKVEVSRASGNSVSTLVREGLAFRADGRTRSELMPIPYAGDQFALKVGVQELSRPALHYTFDDSSGAIVEDSGGEPLFDVNIVASGELDRSPKRGPGRKGAGLVFQPGETLDVALSKDFRLEDPHTIAFWVKIPPRLDGEVQEEILSYGREGLSWGISCNLASHRGVRGAVRINCPSGFVIGSSDIADGNWHHIAYRFLGGEEADIASHLHLFVDGRTETLSDFQAGSVQEGRVGNLRLGGTKSDGFQGWIDDFSLFREAISTAEIQKLLP